MRLAVAKGIAGVAAVAGRWSFYCFRAFWIAAVTAFVIVGISGCGTAWPDQSIDLRTTAVIDFALDNSPRLLTLAVRSFANAALYPCEK